MPNHDTPVNKNLIRFSQHSAVFTDQLNTVMANMGSLHPHQVDGLITHLTRISVNLSHCLATLHSSAVEHNESNHQTNQPNQNS